MISHTYILGIYTSGLFEMKSSIYIFALVLMAIPLVSADRVITEDSGACDLKNSLNTAIKVIDFFIKYTPQFVPSWVRTREETNLISITEQIVHTIIREISTRWDPHLDSCCCWRVFGYVNLATIVPMEGYLIQSPTGQPS